MTIDFTEADLKAFAPKMAGFYVRALLAGKEHLAAAGILENGRRFAHFMGQVGAETGGGTILRESLTYTTTKRIKQVWPARARKSTEAELQKLVRNPVALGDWAYGGRMGNRKGTSDGYDYRGGGLIQTTGRAAVEEYCRKLDMQIRPDILDDPEATLRFACLEWQEAGCNVLADVNDLMGISRAINTGSANSGIYPNGMDDRTAWTKRALSVWEDAERVAVAVAPPKEPARASLVSETSFAKLNALADQGSRLAQHIRAIKTWAWGILTSLWALFAGVSPTAGSGGVVAQWIAAHPFLALAVMGTTLAAIIYVLVKLAERYLLTAAADGRYQPRGEAKP
jgi:putative chitinase